MIFKILSRNSDLNKNHNDFRDYLLQYNLNLKKKQPFDWKKENVMDKTSVDANVLKAIVKKEMALKMANGYSFTCYDITETLREWMTRPILHSEVRVAVNAVHLEEQIFFENADYNRSTSRFSNGGEVEVFHYSSDDPQEYIDNIESQAKKEATRDCSSEDQKCTCVDNEEKTRKLEEKILYLERSLRELSDDISDILTDILTV